MIEISEIYLAPQGEGPNLGRPSLFVRTRRCTLHCAWCDSKFTWDRNSLDFQENFDVYDSPRHLANEMLACSQYGDLCHVVVLTGGEPLIWQRELYEALLLYRRSHACPIEVETSGTVMPSDDMLHLCNFNISHKLLSAGNADISRDRLWREDVVRRIISAGGLVLQNVCFKPAIDARIDDAEVGPYISWLADVGKRLGVSWERLRERVYLMPQATTVDQLRQAQGYVIAVAQELGVRCTTRMQILAYGNERRR